MHVDHTSRVAAAWSTDAAAPPTRVLDGTWVLVDLSGFTRLTEILTDRSTEGAEVLHRTLLTCFDALLRRSVELGGDLIGFAGDAALVRFDGDGHLERAVDAAWTMPRALAALPASTTGGRRLRVSTGVHTGPVHAVLTRTRRRAMFLFGPTMSELVALQDAARPGQVLLGAPVAAALDPSGLADAAHGAAPGVGTPLRRRPRGWSELRWDAPARGEISPEHWQHTLGLLDPSVRSLTVAGARRGDHRVVSVGFVRIGALDRVLATHGLDAVADRLEHVIGHVSDVLDGLGVSWIDTDVGRGGVKLLITAGAPDALPDDEQRLLLALHRIVRQTDVPVAAGAQRGRVFAGPLGVPGRSSYTVLGDAANVAARALGLAADGQVVVADGLDVERRASVTTTSLGPHVLKNHRRPVPMWRIDHVGPLATARPTLRADVAGRVRELERDRLLDAWRGTSSGSGRLVSVIGEPGMGVSELIESVVAHVGVGATSVSGDPLRRTVAFGVIGDVVMALARTSVPAERPEPDEAWTWLASHAPRLPAHLATWVATAIAIASGDRVDDAEDPRTAAARARQVLAALLAVAAPTPWLLAVDRFDEIDDASRSVLRTLQAASVTRPLMILTGATRVEPGDHDPFATVETLELTPLDTAAATALVQAVAPALRDDQVERIVDAANGNPFVLAELANDPDSPELPDSLHRVAAVLLDGLPATLREPVQDAAALGIAFDTATLAAVLDRPDLADVRAWAAADGIVRSDPDGTLRFRHAAYRTTAYAALPYAHRRRLHGRIADHLRTDPRVRDAMLALHLESAGRVDEALPLAAAAGRQSKRDGALVEAADLLGRAAGMARATDRARAAELLVERGEALAWLGDLDGAATAYREARRLGVAPRLGARLCHLVADVALSRAAHRRVLDQVRTGLALADTCPDGAPAERCRLLLDRAWVHHYHGRHGASRAVAQQALEVATSAADPELLGLAHLHLEMTYSVQADRRAVEHGDLALAHFASIGHDRYLEVALMNTGLTAMHLGQWDVALDRYARAEMLSQRLGYRVHAAMAALNSGFTRFRRREFDEAERLARRAWRTFDVTANDADRGYPRLLCGMIAGATDRWDDAERLVADARACFEAVEDRAMVIDCDVVRVGLLVRRGHLAEARSLASELSLGDRIAMAEPDVAIAHDRVVGQAESLLGVTEGHDRMLRALAHARSRGLVYDEYLCLVALVEVERAGGPPAPIGSEAAVAAWEARLGIGVPIAAR